MLVIIGHAWVSSRYHEFEKTSDILNIVCQSLYFLEMILRLVAMKGWTNYNTDPRGESYTMQNKWGLATTIIGVAAGANDWHSKPLTLTDTRLPSRIVLEMHTA